MNDCIKIKTDFFKEGISAVVDEWAGTSNTTRHKAALEIFKIATGGDVAISFDDQNIIVELPNSYLKACSDAGKDDHGIVHDCVANGVLRLKAKS